MFAYGEYMFAQVTGFVYAKTYREEYGLGGAARTLRSGPDRES